MNISDIKVGMRVRRTKYVSDRYPAGFTFDVLRFDSFRAFDQNGVAHFLENLERVSLADALARAEAEVARIKAEIEADRLPKRGDEWLSRADTIFSVIHVERGYVFGEYKNSGCGSWSVANFLINFTRVDKTQDS